MAQAGLHFKARSRKKRSVTLRISFLEIEGLNIFLLKYPGTHILYWFP